MAKTERKIAVVLIHGIGDQRPMATLRSFVEAVLAKDHDDAGSPASSPPAYFSKPDTLSGSFELRRLNAPASGRSRPPTDFYEYYWAHLMADNAVSHTVQWLNNLLFRHPFAVPPVLRKLWFSAWALLVLILCMTAALWTVTPVGLLAGAGALLLLGAKLLAELALRDWIGDAARYFNARPANIDIRNAIRKGGVELLEKLHATGDYRRIIVVGHSLGSAIALDILYHYWTKASTQHGEPTEPTRVAIDALERAIKLTGPIHPGEWQRLQKAVWQELRANGTPWRVTDLITLGSPLAHLPFLTGIDQQGFHQLLLQRELPASPPVLDGKGISYFTRYVLPDGKQRSIATLHHAACFAAARWTNIYFPHDGWLRGDPVGGPLRPLFGLGINDTAVHTNHWGGRLNHLDYWRMDGRDSDKDTAPLDVLKAAMKLDEGFR